MKSESLNAAPSFLTSSYLYNVRYLIQRVRFSENIVVANNNGFWIGLDLLTQSTRTHKQ
jgi:hypothetical protein